MKKFSIALMVLALCLVSLAVSASGTTISANAVVTGDAITVNVEASGNVVVLAMRDSALVSADTLVELKDVQSQIVFVDQFDASSQSSVTFIPKEGVAGSTITIFVGGAGASEVTVLSLVEGGCFVGETIGTDADAGYYMNEAIKEYAISVTADVDTNVVAAANVAKYGFGIYTADGKASVQSTGALADDDAAFAVVATGIPEGAEATEVYFKPYIVLEDGTVYWGAARAFSVNALEGVDKNLGTLADVEAMAN